ncbi:hypothetical protein GCM10017608_04280 [Agromyces luteolus]|uniref:hypothetical protein n=1 Tax=Agromyces luteolus TaxID=88373 RepID=UPI00197AE730|nr:hypothetical protein [Agromyces luteolus]GLK26496.1 hypothetical protein GCM10017608_04280 [Agromyces luteolus]
MAARRVGRVRRLRREAWGFAIGSLCFLVAAFPFYAEWLGPVGVNITFVVGSVFFTLAAFVQLSLSGRHLPRRRVTNRADWWDWWAAAVQFVGTLLFNLSTTLALLAAIAAPDYVGAGWKPDAWGSLAFLAASAFAMVATTHRGELWDTDARTWHGTWLGMLGSVFFGLSAIGAYVIPETGTLLSLLWANLGTMLGALCFLLAALLSRRWVDRGEPTRDGPTRVDASAPAGPQRADSGRTA